MLAPVSLLRFLRALRRGLDEAPWEASHELGGMRPAIVAGLIVPLAVVVALVWGPVLAG